MIRDTLSSIKEQFDRIDEKLGEKQLALFKDQADFEEERLQSLVDNASGDSVSPTALLYSIENMGNATPYNLLNEDEQPHYFLNGTTIDVEGQGAGGENIIGWDRDRRNGAIFTVFTEERILIIANHVRGYDEHTIPYDTVTNTNLNTGLGAKTRLAIQTKSATYHCDLLTTRKKHGKEEIEEAIEYLRERRQQSTESTPVITESEPLDQLEQLKSLYDDGAITEEEFEEKKAALLDDL